MMVRIEALSKPCPGGDAVVVFPHAGASPRFFAPWCQQLPGRVDLYGVTYPGRDALLDARIPATLKELAHACAQAMKPVIASSRSVVLLGHSMGSYVAFEAIRSLELWELPVTALVASGADAPHLAAERCWHLASDDDLLGQVCELDARSRDALAVPELRRMLLPIIRSDLRLVERYRSDLHSQVSCPILIANGRSDPEVTLARTAAWAEHTRANWHIRWFPGDHFYIRAHGSRIIEAVCGIVDASSRSRDAGVGRRL